MYIPYFPNSSHGFDFFLIQFVLLRSYSLQTVLPGSAHTVFPGIVAAALNFFSQPPLQAAVTISGITSACVLRLITSKAITLIFSLSLYAKFFEHFY